MALISVGSGTPSCLVSWTLSRLHSWKLITPDNFLAQILLRRPLPGSHLPPVHLLIFPLLQLIPSVARPLRCLTYAAPDVSLFGVFMGSSPRISCDSRCISPHIDLGRVSRLDSWLFILGPLFAPVFAEFVFWGNHSVLLFPRCSFWTHGWGCLVCP